MRKEKGITLIALVISIIVLLILAGVSISAVIGENGIATKAKESKEETRAANVKEVIDLWKSEKYLEESVNDTSTKSLEEVLDELEDKELISSDERIVIEETGKITIGKSTIVVMEETYKIEATEYNSYFYLYDKDGNMVPIIEEYNPTMQLEGDTIVYTVGNGGVGIGIEEWLDSYGSIYVNCIYDNKEFIDKITDESIVNITLTIHGQIVKYTGPVTNVLL